MTTEQRYDRSCKWLIQHHGDSALRMLGLPDIAAWRALQAEVVQPRQLPDGLLDVEFVNDPTSYLFILELATYPERRLEKQLVRDLMLVFLDRRVLPEVVTLVLHPKGKFEAPAAAQLASPLGLTDCNFRWRVVELWMVPTEDLLAAGDIGLIPWVPLTQFDGPPEPVVRRCREIIDQTAAPDERANLLAVTQVLTELRYNDAGLLKLLGGTQVMIESPLIQKIVAHSLHDAILRILKRRFGSVPTDVEADVRDVRDEEELQELNSEAAVCENLESFRARLQG